MKLIRQWSTTEARWDHADDGPEVTVIRRENAIDLIERPTTVVTREGLVASMGGGFYVVPEVENGRS